VTDVRLRVPAAAVAIVAALVAAFAGCGGTTPAPTTTAVEGATVDAGRYLADAAAGAAAARAFASQLATVGTPATAPALKAVAPRLEEPLASARLVGQRLTAERLADRRLDEQRGRNAVAFGSVIAAMERVQAAAAAGDPSGARTGSLELSAAIGALRDAASSTR